MYRYMQKARESEKEEQRGRERIQYTIKHHIIKCNCYAISSFLFETIHAFTIFNVEKIRNNKKEMLITYY